MSELFRATDPANWTSYLMARIDEAWDHAEILFRDHWAVFWLGAIVVGIWCLMGYALKKNR